MQNTAERWNYAKHEYDPYILPDGASMYETDMNKEITCADCGRKIRFGDAYASLVIHNANGMGYAVCENCNSNENEIRLTEREKDRLKEMEDDNADLCK